jgi:hypothetical protein
VGVEGLQQGVPSRELRAGEIRKGQGLDTLGVTYRCEASEWEPNTNINQSYRVKTERLQERGYKDEGVKGWGGGLRGRRAIVSQMPATGAV